MMTIELVKLYVDVLSCTRGCKHRHGHQDNEAAEAECGDQPRSQPHFLSTIPAYAIQPKAEHPVKTGDCEAPPKRTDFSHIHLMARHSPQRNTWDIGCAFRAVIR